MRPLFDRAPGYDATIFAEAQALLDDGFDSDFVLGLYPGDADWLTGALGFSGTLRETYAAEQPSYYFEASLKNRFLAAARESRNGVATPATAPGALGRARTAIASATVLAGAAAMGVLALGFITSSDSVPGDWNYAFKLTQERVDYALSRGDARIDVQFRQAQERVYEIDKLSARGDLSSGDLEKLSREAKQLANEAQGHQLDEVMRAEIRGLDQLTAAVLDAAAARQPDLQPAITTTKKAASDAFSASIGGTGEAPAPAPKPDATAAE